MSTIAVLRRGSHTIVNRHCRRLVSTSPVRRSVASTIPGAASGTWRRFLDTRLIGLPFEPGETRHLHFAGWVPDGVRSVHLAVTVAGSSSSSVVTVCADDDLASMRTIEFPADRQATRELIMRLPANAVLRMRTTAAAEIIVELHDINDGEVEQPHVAAAGRARLTVVNA